MFVTYKKLLVVTLATQLVIQYQKTKLIVLTCDKGHLTNHDNGENKSDGNSCSTVRRRL